MSQILIYQNEKGDIKVDVRFEDNSICLSQAQLYNEVKFQNLDMIIALSFKVRSSAGTKFRIQDRQKVNEYITKGFVLEDDIKGLK